MPDNKAMRPVKRFLGMRPWLFVVAIVVAIVVISYVTFRQNLLTTYLPNCDRIEIDTMDDVHKKVLTGPETTELLNLWHSQAYDYWSISKCHEPAYRISFYKFGIRITEATICFECENIYFYKYPGSLRSGQYLEVVFDGRNSEGKKLRSYLGNLFPGYDPTANKS